MARTANSRMMRKIGDHKNVAIEHEGNRWMIDATAWHGQDGKGELRVHKVHGDITSPDLNPALQLYADVFGLADSRFVL